MGTGGLALFNRAPNPNAAKVYVNWLLGKEGQTEMARAFGYVSRRFDVPTDHVEPWKLPVAGYIALDGEEAVQPRTRVVGPFLAGVFGN